MTAGLIERYRDRLPVTDATPVVSLGEGSTPLVPAPRLSALTGLDVHLKYEGLNPTGSFKDRGMTVAVSKALEEGATAAVCASTGNTSASAAAYCGRAGIRLAVVLPEGAIARGKLAQAQICGARVIAVQGSFDDALRLVRELVERRPMALLNSINPYRLEGQKTAAFEVIEQLGGAPDWLALPVGNGGNITAYWKGFGESGVAPADAGRPGGRRGTAGDAGAGAQPDHGRDRDPDRQPGAARSGAGGGRASRTAAYARSPTRASWRAYRLLAQEEGVFCEPASAASVAALLEAARDGLVEPGARVVCVLTGHGLKDPDTAGAGGRRDHALPAGGRAARGAGVRRGAGACLTRWS